MVSLALATLKKIHKYHRKKTWGFISNSSIIYLSLSLSPFQFFLSTSNIFNCRFVNMTLLFHRNISICFIAFSHLFFSDCVYFYVEQWLLLVWQKKTKTAPKKRRRTATSLTEKTRNEIARETRSQHYKRDFCSFAMAMPYFTDAKATVYCRYHCSRYSGAYIIHNTF